MDLLVIDEISMVRADQLMQLMLYCVGIVIARNLSAVFSSLMIGDLQQLAPRGERRGLEPVELLL